VRLFVIAPCEPGGRHVWDGDVIDSDYGGDTLHHIQSGSAEESLTSAHDQPGAAPIFAYQLNRLAAFLLHDMARSTGRYALGIVKTPIPVRLLIQHAGPKLSG